MKNSIILFSLLFTLNTFAKKQYISTIQKVTFRTGPGTDNKIIKMLGSDTAVEVVEAQKDWTKIKDADGNEGYVMSRFLSEDTPYALRYAWLEAKHKKTQEKFEALKLSSREVEKELNATKKSLQDSKSSLNNLSSEHENLKTGSSDFIGLKEKYDKSVILTKAQNEKLQELETRLFSHNLIWFIVGAVVLFLGWLIGLFTRKRKGYSSSIRL